MKAPRSRVLIMLGALALVGAFLTFAFWPRPFLADFAQVTKGPMAVTVDEEGKTRVRERYVVSAPITGRLMRVELNPGDAVVGGETVIAEMTPVLPAALDVRTEEQADAAIAAAKAGLALSIAEEKRAGAEAEFATQEAARARALFKTSTIARQAVEQAEATAASARAAREAARAAVAMRRAELAQAEKLLMTPIEAVQTADSAGRNPHNGIPIHAPVSGRILKIHLESEGTVSAGAPILEIGDTQAGLEVVVELLSTDAVKVKVGDAVNIDNWGGEETLLGVVERIEPLAFTKISALGVEEQRVSTIIRLEDAFVDMERLGHGFRVEAHIVLWSKENALRAPTAALFRAGGRWAVYKVENGRARQTLLTIGQNNGIDAEVLEGLAEGDEIILFPGGDIADGVLVAPRPQAAR